MIKRRNWYLLTLILVFSVPWYWPKDLIRPFILGLPVWAFAALGISILFAAAVAWVIRTCWSDDE